jgi:hypothetical protein
MSLERGAAGHDARHDRLKLASPQVRDRCPPELIQPVTLAPRQGSFKRGS